MKRELFSYSLPEELIAATPARQRDQSRLLVLDRDSGHTSHRSFVDILEFLNRGDAVVVNDTRVFKARLLGQRATGGEVELLLVRPREESATICWEALARPSRRLKAGEAIIFSKGRAVELAESLGDGRWVVRFASEPERLNIIETDGHVPLPQYIHRDDTVADVERYQTIFADPQKSRAVAAPTAGFHFSPELLASLEQKGVTVLKVTLHVGPGTFKPISVDNIAEHSVDPEWAELSPEVATRINDLRAGGGKIVAVGTTTVRTLESATIVEGAVQPFAGFVDLYIKPGFTFQVVDRIITNFHLPESSLLVLVSAFARREHILAAYREAIEQKYHFYSYGDAMLIR